MTPRMLSDDVALDRLAAIFNLNAWPDGLRASTETLEEVQRLLRLTGRDAGPQFAERVTDEDPEELLP